MVRADVSHIGHKPLHGPGFHFMFHVLFHVFLRVDGWGLHPSTLGLKSSFVFLNITFYPYIVLIAP